MARNRSDRRESFQGLWPWPGNIFLVLFGAWAFYMGYLAEARDVQLAFYGLTGITALVLLLGLRAIGRKAPAPAERPAMRSIPRTEEVTFSSRDRATPSGGTLRTESAASTRAAPPFPESRPFGPSVDALINREKAARGAQIAKLESNLNERLSQMEARLGEGGGSGAGPGPALDEYLRIETFNSAVNERLLPRIKDMIGAAIDERMAGGAAPQGLAEEVAKLRSLRDVDHREMTELRAALEAARGAEGGAPIDTAALTARIQTVEKGVEARKAELERLSANVRDTVTDMGRHLKRVDEVAADIVRRLERMGADGDGERTPADVAQLRDALATIIEQNRDIKARQEMLSARFEVPTGKSEG